MPETNYEESELLIMLSEDSQYAFQLVFHRYKDHLYKVAMLFVKNPALAEEIVQDTFMKVWLHRKTLPRVRSLESWLYVVAKHLILNNNRRLAREWKSKHGYLRQVATVENTTDHKIETSQYKTLVESALSQLSTQQRAVYHLIKDEHLSYEETGHRLHISPLTVKTHMSRALTAIKYCLKQHGIIISLLIVQIILKSLYSWS